MAGNWDYIPPIVADAPTQMAIDAELAEICNRLRGSAFLRFYSMWPPAVTIGRNQRWRAVVDPEICRSNGWDWVRRPTGGGALLHRWEVNYAVAVSHDLVITERHDSARLVFGTVTEGLMAGLAILGFQSHLSTVRKNGTPSAHGLCGSSLTRYEVSIDGKKAIAAAQWNLSRASLQHGTIYLKAPDRVDRFWPEGFDDNLWNDGQGWWVFNDGTMSGDKRWSVLTDALRDGLTRTLGLSWRENHGSWASRPEVVARQQQWRDERWHEIR